MQTPFDDEISQHLDGVRDVGRVLSESLGTSLELGNRLLST